MKHLKSLFFFLSILGPGIITSFADNDAGGITTYSIAGAHFGYKFLWVLVLITIVLAMVQEMAARMGAVTGKGLSDLIREEFGLRWTVVAMLALLVANIATMISNFAGIAASFEIFGIARFIAVPFMAVFIWLLVVKGSYKFIERVFLGFCLIAFSYVISGFIAHPNWQLALKGTVIPYFSLNRDFIMIFIAFIGTTITPWMQFYLQSSVVDKGIHLKHYKYERIEVLMGSFFTNFISFFIIIACAATLFKHGIKIEFAADAAYALQPFAGNFSGALFALGLLGASTLASFILPLSTSYAVCEAFGVENGLNKKFYEAPVFYVLYTILIFAASISVLMPHIPLLHVMVLAQVIQGVLLPIVLVFMLYLVNNRRIMGQHTNSRVYNMFVWGLVMVLIFASAALVVSPFMNI